MTTTTEAADGTAPLDEAAARRVSYRALVDHLRAFIPTVLREGSDVLVVSRGDDALLQLTGLVARHFPQVDDGRYAGHYPADSDAAIRHLESLRSKGSQFIVFPEPSMWWLDHYADLGRHLRERYREVHRGADCAIFDLSGPRSGEDAVPAGGDYLRHAIWTQLATLLDAVLPPDADVALVSREPAPGLLGHRTVHHILVDFAEGRVADANGQSVVFAVRAVTRAGVRFVVVPWEGDDQIFEVISNAIQTRYRRILRHRRVCALFDAGSFRPVGDVAQSSRRPVGPSRLVQHQPGGSRGKD
jgi:hypothetical protein